MTTTRPPDATRDDRAASWLRWLPPPVVLLAIALGGVMFAITVTKGVQDPDFFWHISAGQLIAQTGQVPSTDPFSFTWLGKPWTPHEWLSELLIYWLVTGLGRIGALIVFGLFPAAIFAILATALRRACGARVLAMAVPFAVGAFVMIGFVTLRPQAISWLLLAGLIWFLLEARPDRPRRFLLLIPPFVVWANLHGLYVIGLGVVGLYALFTITGQTPMSPRRNWVLGALAGVIAASMVTPAGPIGILYPLRYIEGGDWGLANIAEWQSPNFHEPAHMGFLLMIVLLGLNGGRATPGWLVALSWVGVAMGLLALRNAPIAAIFAMPTLVMGLEARLRERDERRNRQQKPLAPSRALGRRVMELITALVIAVGSMLVLIPRDLNAAIDKSLGTRFPVAGVDALEQLAPDSNVLAEYGWGGYVIWRLHDDGGRVFVDGRNDMYSQQVLDDYSAIRAADPGWEQLAARYDVQALLFPPEITLTRGPAATAGWCEVLRDEWQVLYLRSCPLP
ncbi:MAG: hypothetical protein WD402_05610 [Chloroflexota bacterium]